jgi:hypothetical protein
MKKTLAALTILAASLVATSAVARDSGTVGTVPQNCECVTCFLNTGSCSASKTPKPVPPKKGGVTKA